MANENPRATSERPEVLHPRWEEVLGEHREAIGRPERHDEIKERLRERVQEESHRIRPTVPVMPQQTVQGALVHPDARDIAAMPDARKVVALAQIALTEGIEPAIRLARSIDSAYVLDAFHDVLVDKLFNELIKRGKLHRQ
ncbi:MAG: hypothetical protein A2806_03310 [Candidatus Terrybacteria bacterium RIFCSPHIGHO2_01_FULL_48_17]|uniref:Uncharacterized protein n=1 Tax=Candidatus Terrybacteria bacterium RIFCSPHIGHO2_01_FULL_48_17 TaxID=1802362 RepID=A0A1G2PJ11_9BACT|nr:MAG: hypothetical protein A2806_03310 [Candidatus Terrybacteria bacterium RIFCSPHIGHO2_01_FULL_48_17]OHA53142.1 MAG: hypothetical protein A3A30_02150 [Candidatus Terrybacteria bacterium RIFCSPLOWO2_01_FULL_48_14]